MGKKERNTKIFENYSYIDHVGSAYSTFFRFCSKTMLKHSNNARRDILYKKTNTTQIKKYAPNTRSFQIKLKFLEQLLKKILSKKVLLIVFLFLREFKLKTKTGRWHVIVFLFLI